MAKPVRNTAAKSTTSLSLLGILKQAGLETSVQKTKLWSEPKFVAEDLSVSAFEFIQVSKKYENSVYAVIREGDESILIPFNRDEFNMEDLVLDEDNKVNVDLSGLTDEVFAIGIVTALRDENDFEGKSIAKGDTTAKLYWV